ncbi:AAA domain-containing protein [Terribacillus sp. 179-K 1B1 HS]|uniref:AAA domain-containing protein n=1 Tax=Terribacillus sp. 179-K 1B1 HS TaxID=3142388 RepID=UPI0039A3D458
MTFNMTKYFRDSIASKLRIDFKNNEFAVASINEIQYGKTDKKHFDRLQIKKKISQQTISVILIVKSIKTIFAGQEKKYDKHELDELNGIYYVPATLTSEGVLEPPDNKYPWIAREHLAPIIDQDIAVGSLNDFDEFFSDNLYRLKKMSSWEEYYTFVCEMYEQVTKTKITANLVNGMELDEKIYIIRDETINSTAALLKLYDHLLTSDLSQHTLYQNFMKQEVTPLIPLLADNSSNMKKHLGQMGGEYPLSPSQRECLHHFNAMEEGEILAVNGPPGTGKTTLLQSLVANLFVERAIKKETAPVIVASSTNNQAVTNIIESFGKIEKQWTESNLETRWITGVDSFAVYFPSLSKEEEAKRKGFQFTNPRGKHFFDKLESEDNIKESTAKMLKACKDYFGQAFTDILECESAIWQRLTEVNGIRESLLSVMEEFNQQFTSEYDMETYIEVLGRQRAQSEQKYNAFSARIDEWIDHFKKLPKMIRWFGFLPYFKKRKEDRNRYFIQPDETYINESMSENEIISIYSKKTRDVRNEMENLKGLESKAIDLTKTYKNHIRKLVDLKIVSSNDENMNSLYGLNEFLDTTAKYASFWLAVHYYECRWLQARRLTDNQKGKNFPNVLQRMYTNLSMVSPCFVMTFYQLPKMLLAYDNGKEHYLYDYIDLLIVDEAGQVSPEIAACSFSLAKRAVVVGDVHQIEPVWNINKSLDISLALSSQVINSIEEFDKLSNLGLNTSESSVMKVACKSCRYEKYSDRGLFLSEHRRCYDEIIKYCNHLVYKGNLKPKRGKAALDDDNKIASLPIKPLGHIQVTTAHSQKRAGSRYNEKEASEIAEWLNENFSAIKKSYQGDEEEMLVGIITPFKAQVSVIKNKLSKELRTLVDVGTVHTFQGGERKIIIMSTVYGHNDGCFFIDANKSLLNVAVSRAKDSFLAFGDIGCLSNSESKPSGLLKRMAVKMHDFPMLNYY